MNLVSIMEENACLFSESAAIIDDAVGSIITYQDLWGQVDAAASGLISIGVEPGDRVAVYLPNGKDFIIAYFAILKVGAIAVPFNILFKRQEIKRIMKNSASRVIIGSAWELSKEFIKVRDSLTDLQFIISVGPVKAACADADFGDWLESKGHAAAAPFTDDQPAAIYYTSGTTGQMKGVVLSHNSIAVNAKINGHYLLGLNDQDRVLGLSPFSHAYFFQVVLGPLSVGAAAVAILRSSPRLTLQAIEKYRVTHLSTVPTMFRYLLETYREHPCDVGSWRIAGSAAANVNLDLVREIEDTFQVDFFDTYGSTEASSTITYTRLRHYVPGSVGRPAHSCQVRIVDNQNKEVPAGEVGELLVKGPGIFNSYWDMPEFTEQAFTSDKWYKSGDMARQDKEGNIYIMGRKKDMIISGGYKIYSWEVEELLLSHPGIADAVVVGKPDLNLGEVAVGYIKLTPGFRLNPEDIMSFCQERLASYKCPRFIEFKSDFPRANSGKILKRLL